MLTQIEPISKTYSGDYSNENYSNFWLSLLPSANNDLLSVCKNNIIETLQNIENSIVCIQSPLINDAHLMQAILQAAERKNRIYVLTNSKEGLKNLAGKCLLRYGCVQPISGTFLLINPRSAQPEGHFFSANFTTPELDKLQLFLALNAAQIKDLFEFFCNQFWNMARFEIKHASNFEQDEAVKEKPINFEPNTQNLCNIDFIKNHIKKEIQNVEHLYIPDWSASLFSTQTDNLQKAQILTNSSKISLEVLQTLHQQNNTIYSTPAIPLHFAVTTKGVLLFSQTHLTNESKEHYFALDLDAKQSDILKKVFDNYLQKTDKQFTQQATRKQMQGKELQFIQPTRTIIVKDSTSKKLDDIKLHEWKDRTEFEQQKPSNFPDDGVHLQIHYEWEIIPFYLPQNAKQDSIYTDWESCEKSYKNYWQAIQTNLSEAEKLEEAEKSKSFFSRLTKLFLGKKKTFNELKEKLENLLSFEKDTKKATLQIKNLAEIQEQIGNDKREIQKESALAEKKELEENLSNKQVELNNYQKEQKPIVENKKKEIYARINKYLWENRLLSTEQEKQFLLTVKEQNPNLAEKMEALEKAISDAKEALSANERDFKQLLTAELQKQEEAKKSELVPLQEALNNYISTHFPNYKKDLKNLLAELKQTAERHKKTPKEAQKAKEQLTAIENIKKPLNELEAKHRQELEEHKKQYEAKQNEIFKRKKQGLEDALQTATSQLQTALSQNNCYPHTEDFLEGVKNSLIAKSNNKKAQNAESSEQADLHLQSISTEESFANKTQEEFDKECNKQQKEIDDLERKIKAKDTEIQKNEPTATTSNLDGILHGKNPSKQTSSTSHLTTPSVPTENLPLKGELFSFQNQRYLAIEYWEDAEQAKEEASRLHAKLCVKPPQQ